MVVVLNKDVLQQSFVVVAVASMGVAVTAAVCDSDNLSQHFEIPFFV